MSRPRILVLNQYYAPGFESTAQLLTQLCEALAEDYDVTVVTGVVEGGSPSREIRNGVEVVRVFSTVFERRRLALRATNYLTYVGSSLWRALTERRPDVVLCMSDPPFIGMIAYAAARRHRAPYVTIEQDVFPEIAVQLGRLENPLLVGTLGALVGFGLKHADRVVAIGETMRRRLVEKGVARERIDVIPNWIDSSELSPQPKANEWAEAHGLADKFVVMHSGNVGYAQDLDTLMYAAEQLRDLEDLVVVVVGHGARRPEVMQLAEQLGLENVLFLPYQPRERLPESLSAADVHVVGLAPGLAGYVVPSRLYGILAVARPVVAAVETESETAHIVETAECGLHVPPASPDLLAAAIRDCHSGRVDLEQMGRNGRAYIEREGDRTIAVGRYRSLLAEVRSAREHATMRVLRVIARLNVGGPALHVSYLTRGLAPLGYETTLATGRIGSSEGSMEYVASELQVRPVYIEALQRNVSAFADLVALVRLVRLIRTIRPNVLHTHTAKAGALGRVAAVLALGARPPVVVHTFHGHVLTGYFSKRLSRLFLEVERRLAHVSDALIAVSPQVRDDLVGLGVAPREKFVVIRLGLDLERRIGAPADARERVRAELAVEDDSFLVVWLGRMTEIKRVDRLLHAFARLRDRGVDATLALVGDGPDRAGLEQLARELGVAEAVRFTGFRTDVGSLFRAADAVALSSANEGTPVSLIEALAAGCAVITTDVGGAADVVDAGRAGLLVPPDDVDAFADGLERLARSPELRRELGEAGRRHVASRYSVDRLVEDVDRLYRTLLVDGSAR